MVNASESHACKQIEMIDCSNSDDATADDRTFCTVYGINQWLKDRMTPHGQMHAVVERKNHIASSEYQGCYPINLCKMICRAMAVFGSTCSICNGCKIEPQLQGRCIHVVRSLNR